jgi:hypothetical protein
MLAALLLIGCHREQASARVDPHSRVGVMKTLMEQADLLKNAADRGDYKYVHDFMYYFDGLAASLRDKLTEAQLQRVTGLLDELTGISRELDESSGRRQAEAVQAQMARLQETLGKVEDQLRDTESPNPTSP